jgi:hypothetical protein
MWSIHLGMCDTKYYTLNVTRAVDIHIRTISVVYPYFEGKLHLKKVQQSDRVILKIAGAEVHPPPQVLVVNELICMF